MDWLLWPLIFVGLFSHIVCRECSLDKCTSTYKTAIDEAGIMDPEKTTPYCQILTTYRQCLDSTTHSCRGDLTFHTAEFVAKKWENENCSHKSSAGPSKPGTRPKTPHGGPSSSKNSPRPSCKYFGSFKFRFCSLFGDPHLKTFDGMYQTCRVNGTWALINNSYISVHVTNRPVVENSAVTAPTKITVVVKSRSTPCTLEKRYSADGESPLPNTFDDGTDRPGSDETVSLHFQQNGENRETVEIFIKYIATRLIIRRVGRYLAFSARLPEEVFETSHNYEEESIELCTTGCPASEQLDIAVAHPYVMGREQALAECDRVDGLDADLRNRLTDSYLDWCLFDVMTSGTVYDFVAVAHSAQAEALDMDARSLANRTQPIELRPSPPEGGPQAPISTAAAAAGAAASSNTRFHLLRDQLPVFVACLLCTLCRFALL